MPLYDSGQWLFKPPLMTSYKEEIRSSKTSKPSQNTKSKRDVLKIMICSCGEIFVDGVGCGKCRCALRILRS